MEEMGAKGFFLCHLVQAALLRMPPFGFPTVLLWRYFKYQILIFPGEKELLWEFFILLCFLSAVVRRNTCLFASVKLMFVKDLTNIFFPCVYQASEFKQ